jgi:hypothetical protein
MQNERGCIVFTPSPTNPNPPRFSLQERIEDAIPAAERFGLHWLAEDISRISTKEEAIDFLPVVSKEVQTIRATLKRKGHILDIEEITALMHLLNLPTGVSDIYEGWRDEQVLDLFIATIVAYVDEWRQPPLSAQL